MLPFLILLIMKTFSDILKRLHACPPAIAWVNNRTVEEALENTVNADWIIWTAKKLDISLREITLAKALCAKTIIHLMKDRRSLNIIDLAEQYGLGKITLQELERQAFDALVVYNELNVGDDDIYAYAAYTLADPHNTYSIVNAVHHAITFNTIKNNITDDTVKICREILGDLIINKINSLL